MAPGDGYRSKAAELHARARREPDPQLRMELEGLANAYRRLAGQADRNAGNDIVYETPDRSFKDRPNA